MDKILVVDDQRNMRTTLALMLRAAGYEVDDCGSGEEGKELGATGGYDLVITDLRLGAVDGLEVLRAVRDSVSNTEVMVMTAYGTIESAVEAMRLAAEDYAGEAVSFVGYPLSLLVPAGAGPGSDGYELLWLVHSCATPMGRLMLSQRRIFAEKKRANLGGLMASSGWNRPASNPASNPNT